jgi:DNA helicase HerA-like ATPase
MSVIQVPDGPGTNPTTITVYAFNEASLSAGGFVLVECTASGRRYLAQVIAAQLNFNRDGLGPADVTTINQLERLEAKRLAREVVVKEVHCYSLLLLKDVTGDVPASVRRRPQIGSIGRAATDAEVIRFLGLPADSEEALLGWIMDTQIPVCLDDRVVSHHVLIAGSTGSGKSNTIANGIVASLADNKCVIIYDHKPDYQNLDEPNSEISESWRCGITSASFWGLGPEGRRRDDEGCIGVPASELDPAVLAHTICYQRSEVNAAEVLDTLLYKYAEMKEGARWSLDEFYHELPANAPKAQEKFGVEINAATYSAMRNRLGRRQRRPVWIDASAATVAEDFFRKGTQQGGTFDLRTIAAPGRALVVRVPSTHGDGRSYALFLSYLLRQVYQLREECPNKSPKFLHVIDEAQDIFNAGLAFQTAAGDMLNGHIRKGRSRGISFIIGVQSADAVPDDIRNNLNSQVIHRHNNHRQAIEAMNRATREQLAMTDTFAPGECLAYLFGSSAVIHARMRRSPFNLTKE